MSEHVIDNFLCNVANRTHCNNNSVCIRSAVVVEQLIICTDLSVNLIHVIFNNIGKCIIILVASFSVLEEYIAVFSGATKNRMFRVDSSCTECSNCILIYHRLKIFIIPYFDLLNFMRSTEAVKEIDKRNSALYCCQMSNSAEVHNFLRI